MRGKKPKERQRYVLRVNETLVEVTRDVYLAWYQSRRKERYQLEKMQKNGVCGIEKVGETSYNSYLHILSPEEGWSMSDMLMIGCAELSVRKRIVRK